MITKLKIWGITLVLAVVGVLFGINRLKRRQRRVEIERTGRRVTLMAAKVNEKLWANSANSATVSEARRRLENHVTETDVELVEIDGRIHDRETRILNLRARLDALRGSGS